MYEPRTIWNTLNIAIGKYEGTPIVSKAGHSFIKEVMRKHHAIYGIEVSAHHFFRDFSYCDSGMILKLLILEYLLNYGVFIVRPHEPKIQNFPSSGELNFNVKDPDEVMKKVLEKYASSGIIDTTDADLVLHLAIGDLILRKSNTETFLRLNVEGNRAELVEKENILEKTNNRLVSLARNPYSKTLLPIDRLKNYSMYEKEKYNKSCFLSRWYWF